MLLAIDPGTDTGWAVFDHGRRLVACGLGTPPNLGPFNRVLIEIPKLRPNEKNPQDILKLAIKAGEWGGIFAAQGREYLTPNEWKGALEKKKSHPRIIRALDERERAVLERSAKPIAPRLLANATVYELVGRSASVGRVHNVLDAIGLGLHGVGRNANG